MMSNTLTSDAPAKIGFRTRRTAASGLAAILLLAASSGCTTWNLTDAWSWSNSTPKSQTPARMTDVWTDTVYHQPGQRGVRGFGGRVMFYGEEGHKTVVVDGTFVVLAYDDTDSERAPIPPEMKSPERKFVILPDQLPNHYSKSDLGHSYSFWLPWDEVGNPERRICLVARFEPRKGRPIVSHPSHHVLPGPSANAPRPNASRQAKARNAEPNNDPLPVKTASYDAPSQKPSRQEVPSRAELATLTIDLPPSFPTGANGKPGVVPDGHFAEPSSGGAADKQGKTLATRSEDDAATASHPVGNRSAASRSAARKGPDQAGHNPIRRRPLPAAWQSRLPPTPRSGPASGSSARQPVDDADGS